MNLKKALIIGGIALVLFFVISNPNGAAGTVNDMIEWLKSAAESFIQFVSGIF